MATIALAARVYQQSFHARPYTTLALTNGSLTAVGDLVAQLTQILTAKASEHDDPPQFDPQRTLRFFTFGFAMGPLIGRWNKLLELRFPLFCPTAGARPGLNTFSPLSAGVQFGSPSSPASNAAAAWMGSVGVRIGRAPHWSGLALAKRVAADQLVFAPLGLALFLGAMGTMEADRGHTATHVRRKFHELYGGTLITNWKVWPLAQIINFRYMPLAYRVPFQSTCGIFWNLYLSLINAQDNRAEKQKSVLHDTLG